MGAYCGVLVCGDVFGALGVVAVADVWLALCFWEEGTLHLF